MKLIKYFIQFILIIFLFLLFKILGLKLSKSFSSFIFKTIGPHFRSKNISHSNLNIAFPRLDESEKNKVINDMWASYGKIFAEYIFIKDFRRSPKFSKKIIIENQKGLDKVKQKNTPVIFISGHFDNFELMAMHIEKFNINKNYIIFSGIGNPDSFKKLLHKNKFKIIEEITFPDHYNYQEKDILEIINKANDNSAEVITTEKDFKRIPQNLKEKISFLEINIKIKDETKLVQFLKTKINEIN